MKVRNLPSIHVGQGVLELLSSAMYVNPLTLFREYIQNAVDAIDDAVATGHLASHQEGRIAITLDADNRRVVLRDNGIGLTNHDFATTMLTFGDSPKRGKGARGFRGVGRLAGLGYTQKLIFRSKATSDAEVMEAVWDVHKIKQLLATDAAGDLETLVQNAVTITTLGADDYPNHFFEVELVKPRRIANDRLMNEVEIATYLSQVAPCPFAPDFSYGASIAKLLAPYGRSGRVYAIYINNSDAPVYRPYRDIIPHSKTQMGRVYKLEPFKITGSEIDVAAVGWWVHHDCLGAIPSAVGVRGLRARIGNMQVGDERLFAEVFPEDRFCAWSVGEVHVLDPRVFPNGRRDAFESSTHLDNIVNHLRPLGMAIARQCRVSSQKRNRLKAFATSAGKVHTKLDILKQGAVSEEFATAARTEIGTLLDEMRKAMAFGLFDNIERKALEQQMSAAEKEVDLELAMGNNVAFQHLPLHMQVVYRDVIDLIYTCSASPVTAKTLVDRILERL